ncbi:hypothetical protein GCM10028822_43160 [Hymenobacter terrigena]
MGEHAALTAKEWGIPREAQDELAAASHQRLAAAYDRGFFDDLLTPFLKLSRDQNLRPDSTAEKLAKLKPAFGGRDGTMTAGNSTPLTDGAGVIDGLPPLPIGSPVHIEMTVDNEGLLTVDATEPSTGKSLHIQVRVSVLSSEEVVEATNRVSALTVSS